MKPTRLFHYQRFVEAHLASLLSAGQLKLSRPDSFNDPWDCRVHYQLPAEPADMRRLFAYLTEIHRKHDPGVSEAQRQRRVAEFMVNPSKLQAAFVQLEKDIYAAVCRQYRILVINCWKVVRGIGCTVFNLLYLSKGVATSYYKGDALVL